MKIYSNIITRATIGAACPAGVHLQDTFEREGWFQPIREFKPRRDFKHGYEVYLTGSSSYAAAHDQSEKAATWDEWGEFIAALYFVDPNARIGPYKGRDDFMRQTQQAKNHNETMAYRPRKNMTAPWLTRAA